jgi:hypothetical protein
MNGNFFALTEKRRAKREQSKRIKVLAAKELTYLEDRTTFWVQQRSPEYAGTSTHGRPNTSVSHVLKSIKDIQEGSFLA